MAESESLIPSPQHEESLWSSLDPTSHRNPSSTSAAKGTLNSSAQSRASPLHRAGSETPRQQFRESIGQNERASSSHSEGYGFRTPPIGSPPSQKTARDKRPAHNRYSLLSAAPRAFNRSRPADLELQDNFRTGYSGDAFQSASPPSIRSAHSRVDSIAHLLSTPRDSILSRTPRSPYRASLLGKSLEKRWPWRSLWVMYLFFLFGLLFCVGHHIFYATLQGRPADNQVAMLRYGTILAFGAKASMAAAVITSFRQRVWTTVKSKLLSVAAIDSLFAATEDVAALFNVEIYKRAKVASLLAIYVWLTPLVIILTSNTLVVEQALDSEDSRCPTVRTLNFTQEELEDWRTPTDLDDLIEQSVSVWNSTTVDTSSPDWVDYWTAPSGLMKQVATLAAYSSGVMPRSNASLEICGAGWNCTFNINFTGPGYKCTELGSGVGANINQLGDNITPFNTSVLVPEGNYSYYVFATGGEYSSAQMNASYVGGMPVIDPPFPKDLGAMRTEPIIWVGHSVIVNPNTTASTINSSDPGWNEAFKPTIFACQNYETAYQVSVNYSGGQQFTNVTSRTFLTPVINTTYDPQTGANDGTNDGIVANPKQNYIFPTDVRRYRRAAAFHSIGYYLRAFINGTVTSNPVFNPIANTEAIATKLLDPKNNYFPYPNIMDLVQGFCEDIVLSMLSQPQLLSVVWAAQPGNVSGAAAGDDSTLYPCTRSRLHNVYGYHARDLWIVYGLALLLAAIAVALGTKAVVENEGIVKSTRFSSIVAATRGPALEKLGWATDDRGDIPSDVRRMKMGYGIVHRTDALGISDDSRYPERDVWENGDIHYGFGLEGDVRQLRSPK